MIRRAGPRRLADSRLGDLTIPLPEGAQSRRIPPTAHAAIYVRSMWLSRDFPGVGVAWRATQTARHRKACGGAHMSAVNSLSASPEIPFFNIFDPEFSLNSAEMTSAQAGSWYAASPVGLLVLRYAEAQELLRDRRLDHNGKRYMEQTCGVFSGPAYDWLPPEDYATFRVWGTDIGLVFSVALGGDIPARVENAVTGLSGSADSLIERKEAAPADDLISALVAARHAAKVTDEELRDLVVTMVFATYGTTRQQLGNAMAAFAAHPAQWTMLASHPELGEQAADEAIRWCPTANSVYRYAAVDFVYRDLPIARYTYLMMCVPTAQRDPRVFRDGQRFDITIPGTSSHSSSAADRTTASAPRWPGPSSAKHSPYSPER